jgi:hypothetical protein
MATPLESHPPLSREQLADLLTGALRNVCRQSGADTAFSAVVMRELNQVAREAMHKAKEWVLDGAAFGAALFPNLAPEEWGKLKPRDFFKAFADIAELKESPTGDLLIWKDAETDGFRLAEDRAAAKVGLRATMAAITTESGKTEIACSALKLRLSKENAPDEKRDLGYGSFREWLEDCNDIVTFVDFRSGGRVRLLAPGETATKPVVLPSLPTRGHQTPIANHNVERMQNGYIIVESGSILRSLSDLLHREPEADFLPQWDVVMKHFRTRWPADVWKGLYFVYAPRERAESLDGFFKYLAGNAYQPIHLYDREHGQMGPRAIGSVQQQIDAIAQRNCHVVVVTHSGALAPNIERLLELQDRRGSVAVCGLLDLMDGELCNLRERSVELFDLERDVRCFRSALPRFRPVPADQFDPTRYL